MDALDAGQLHLRRQFGPRQLPLRVHLGLVDGPDERQFARRTFRSGGQFAAQSFGRLGGVQSSLAEDAVRLPERHQHGDEHDRAEEPLRLGTGLAGAEEDEPRDCRDADHSGGHPADDRPHLTPSVPALFAAVRRASVDVRQIVPARRPQFSRRHGLGYVGHHRLPFLPAISSVRLHFRQSQIDRHCQSH
jgi:hypothetical protein